MNSKEIKEALEIIKKPITVNCIEYKYFDDENYNKLIEVYDNCLWFANNLEQINLTVENLQKENQKLKEQNERLLELCMYALISSTKIYNHELANDTKKSFINIIKNNLNYDTYILKNKLLEAWRSDK